MRRKVRFSVMKSVVQHEAAAGQDSDPVGQQLDASRIGGRVEHGPALPDLLRQQLPGTRGILEVRLVQQKEIRLSRHGARQSIVCPRRPAEESPTALRLPGHESDPVLRPARLFTENEHPTFRRPDLPQDAADEGRLAGLRFPEKRVGDPLGDRKRDGAAQDRAALLDRDLLEAKSFDDSA